MSVIQRIRDRAAWIIFGAIALALIAFIAQDSSFRRGNLFSNSTTIGKINGEKIEKTEFDAKMDMVQQMQGAQAGQREQLMGRVWEFMVNQTILKQQLNLLGIVVPDKELSDLLFGQNSPFAREFTDPQTGVFDVEKAKQAFDQVKKSKNKEQQNLIQQAYIQPAIDQALSQKYQSLITQAIYVPKWMVEKLNADNNGIASISYVYTPYSSIADSTVKVNDEEIETYIRKNEKLFKQEEETRTVSYVSFSAAPSSQDSVAVVEQLAALKPAFAATADAKSFVGSKGSEMPYYDGYITKTNMKMPNADSIMRLADGQVFGPYLDGQNFTVAKMIGRRLLPDSVKVRHILVKTADQGQPTLPDSIAKKRIDSIETAIKAGANFNELVIKYSDDPGSKATKGEYSFSSSQFGNMSPEFSEAAFYGKVGDKKVVKVENGTYAGYHYVEVLEQKNTQEAYKIAYLSKPIVASQETISAASTAAQQFAASSRNRKAFDATAAKSGKPALTSPEIRANDFQVSGIGNNRAFVKWVYENDLGDVSDPTEIEDHYIVAVITAVNQAGLLSVQAARPAVEMLLKNEKKAQQLIAGKFKGNTLEAYAQSAGTGVQKADSISFQAPFIPSVGSEAKIVGAAFNKSLLGKVSSPIAGTTGVFAIKSESVSAKPAFGGSLEEQRKALETNMRAQIGYQALNALRKDATIKDYRAKFF